MTDEIFRNLAALSAHLAARREAIMQRWREASKADPGQTTANTLTRTQFNDHIPEVLDAFEARLRARSGSASAAAADHDETIQEGKHGRHRWQQGYDLREIVREWGHLHLCLNDELDDFFLSHPECKRDTIAAAHFELTKLINTALGESTEQYSRLDREEAAGRARDLEQALAELGELDRRRSGLIRQAVHDLGGNLQAVSTAASLLSFTDLPDGQRKDFSETVNRGIRTLRGMLGDLMNLARLEAGEEKRNVAAFDAAVVLKELCKTCQPLAMEQRLTLEAMGPDSLAVAGDADKVHRIAQNLVQNALKYTEEGGVTVSWGEEGQKNWWIKVKDTGPGLLGGPAATVQKDRKSADGASGESPEVWSIPRNQKQGEGIGLSIVKRLCELLDATLEVVSSPQEGTAFRIVLPRSYPGD